MVRGCQKQVYVVKDTHSALFTEAYFILKPEHVGCRKPVELSEEAARLIGEMDRRPHLGKGISGGGSVGQRVGAFVVGAASSSAIIGGIALLLAFA